ncbi:MAG TPA: TonB-dependent receptor, partial [Gemmatimonadaceae bacterium]|nr:TonB-dependent receptor [Gemmatimonadaceae bacterium]
MPLPSTRRRRVALALSTLLLAAGATRELVAQSVQTGTLDGRVMLADGRAIANATVQVRQSDGSYPRTTRTDGTGQFSLPFLMPGRYDVTVRQLGFREVQVVAVSIRVAERTRLTITLDRARDTLPAVVVTEAAQARTTPLSPEVTFTLSARERERLPAPRDANALVRFTPGVRPGQLLGGSTNQANLYQLDGVTVNQPGLGGSFLLPNVDWLEDVRVIGLGAGAEYGHFQGGLVNLVTKSGTNTLQGALRTFVEQRALNGTTPGDVDVRAELEDRYEVSGDLRGPIVRDRLYFFVSGQEVRVRERVPASFTDGGWLAPYTERRERKYYGKLTWQATGNDLVHLSLGLDDLARERVGLSPFVAAEATTRGESPSLFFQGSWQRVQSATRQLDVRVSGYAGRDDELPYNGDRPSVSLLDDPDVPRFVNATYTRRNTPRSIGFNVVQSLRLSAGPVTHRVKAGVDATIGSWRETRTRNGGLSWYTEAGANFDPADASTWQTIPSLGIYATADTGSSIDLNAGTLNGALFLQDELQVGSRLALSLGLRLNAFNGTIRPGHGGASSAASAFSAVRAGGVDPRLGVTYDIAADRRTLLKAHWGRYHQNLFALMF